MACSCLCWSRPLRLLIPFARTELLILQVPTTNKSSKSNIIFVEVSMSEPLGVMDLLQKAKALSGNYKMLSSQRSTITWCASR